MRAAAQSWRNGIGALLAGLIGFGLIKGRADIGELASPYDAVVVGSLLAAALASWTALQRGVLLAYACALLLCTAVAITWYGPAKDDPQVEISLSNGTVRCGKADLTTPRPEGRGFSASRPGVPASSATAPGRTRNV